MVAGAGVAGAQMQHEGAMHHEAAMQPLAKLDIDTGTVARQASPKMYGLMTEEINHAYEGGLYAELINNNTFRGDWLNVREWAVVVKGDALATAELDKTDGPSAALPTSMELKVASASERNEAGLSNPGYWGIAVRAHTTYKGSFYAKADADMGPVTARLVSNDTGAVLAQAKVELGGSGWTRYAFELKTGEVAKVSGANHFELTGGASGDAACAVGELVSADV